MLRALILGFPEFEVVPQGEVEAGSLVLHPDLVDRLHMVVYEADSFEFHTSKPAHDRDCERFTALAVAGWTVIRFSWEQVMLRADYVRGVLIALSARVNGRPDVHDGDDAGASAATEREPVGRGGATAR